MGLSPSIVGNGTESSQEVYEAISDSTTLRLETRVVRLDILDVFLSRKNVMWPGRMKEQASSGAIELAELPVNGKTLCRHV